MACSAIVLHAFFISAVVLVAGIQGLLLAEIGKLRKLASLRQCAISANLIALTSRLNSSAPAEYSLNKKACAQNAHAYSIVVEDNNL